MIDTVNVAESCISATTSFNSSEESNSNATSNNLTNPQRSRKKIKDDDENLHPNEQQQRQQHNEKHSSVRVKNNSDTNEERNRRASSSKAVRFGSITIHHLSSSAEKASVSCDHGEDTSVPSSSDDNHIHIEPNKKDQRPDTSTEFSLDDYEEARKLVPRRNKYQLRRFSKEKLAMISALLTNIQQGQQSMTKVKDLEVNDDTTSTQQQQSLNLFIDSLDLDTFL